MKRNAAIFSVLTVIILLSVYLLRPSVNQRIAAQIINEKLYSDTFADVVGNILRLATRNTRFSARWQINRPLREGYLNVYILRRGIFNEGRSYSDDFHNLAGSCAYLGKPDLIVCDQSFFYDFMTAYFKSHKVPASQQLKPEQASDLILWVICHELGHIIAGHSAAHFQKNNLDIMVSSSSFNQKREFEADSFVARQLQQDDKAKTSLMEFLIELINVEIVIKQGKTQPGAGLIFDARPVEFSTRASHPEYIIRAIRLLQLMDLSKYSSGIGYQLRELSGLLKTEGDK